jgi:hypothetical protein
VNSPVDISNVLPYLLTLAGSGVGVVLLAQLIKKAWGMNSDAFIHAMVVLVSAVATLASYILQYKNLPPIILGISGPAIYGFSQGLYKSAKVLGDLLPRIQAALRKPANTVSPEAAAAVAAMNVPADTVTGLAPAPPENNEFNS